MITVSTMDFHFNEMVIYWKVFRLRNDLIYVPRVLLGSRMEVRGPRYEAVAVIQVGDGLAVEVARGSQMIGVF